MYKLIIVNKKLVNSKDFLVLKVDNLIAKIVKKSIVQKKSAFFFNFFVSL